MDRKSLNLYHAIFDHVCILFVANGEKPCSITSCLACETSPIRTSELCEKAKPFCENVNKLFVTKTYGKISTKQYLKIRPYLRKIENPIPSICIPELHRIFPVQEKLRGTHAFSIFLLTCIILFIVICQRYFKFLKSHWSIY